MLWRCGSQVKGRSALLMAAMRGDLGVVALLDAVAPGRQTGTWLLKHCDQASIRRLSCGLLRARHPLRQHACSVQQLRAGRSRDEAWHWN